MKLNKFEMLMFLLLIAITFIGNPNANASTLLQVDSIIIQHLDEIKVFPNHRGNYRSYRFTRKYRKTLRNMLVVYPYAKFASAKINKLNMQLSKIENKRQRKIIIKKEYKSIMKVYKKPMMKLKVSQGRLLMKLIYRETGSSSFSHIKELKGGFTAFVWQSMAKMFGSDLKKKYDPFGEDWMAEEIIMRIERGEFNIRKIKF